MFKDQHLGGLVLDQDRHVHEERVLGHAARSAHGCQHAAWPDLPIACRRRNLGPRCALSGRIGPKLIKDRRRSEPDSPTGTVLPRLAQDGKREYRQIGLPICPDYRDR